MSTWESMTTRWPTWTVRAGVAFGLIAALRILASLDGAGITGVVTMLGAWQAMGATAAATVLLLVTGVQRLRHRPCTALIGAAPRTVALIGGAALALTVLLSQLRADRFASELVIMAAAGAVLAWSGWRARPPMAPERAVALLIATIAIVIIPRELGWLEVRWSRSHTHTTRHTTLSHDCRATGWNGPVTVPALTRSWRRVGQLGGDIGALVAAADDSPPEDGELQVTIDGTIDGGGLLCYVPLYKSVHVATTLSISYTVEVGGGRASCSGSGSVDLTIDVTTRGIASCRDVRVEAAREISEQLGLVAKSIAGG